MSSCPFRWVDGRGRVAGLPSGAGHCLCAGLLAQAGLGLWSPCCEASGQSLAPPRAADSTLGVSVLLHLVGWHSSVVLLLSLPRCAEETKGAPDAVFQGPQHHFPRKLVDIQVYRRDDEAGRDALSARHFEARH